MSAERQTTTKLEPRVAKLEVGLDRLTDDVRDLANVVRSQGANMEQEIQKLVVAVTQAAGPRKTDWSTIIAAVMMVMAIGAAVLIPLNQTAQENKAGLVRMEQTMDDHSKVANHPVGEALIMRLEEQLKLHEAWGEKSHAEVRQHFHDEISELSKYYDQRLAALAEKTAQHDERLYGRVVKLEDKNLMSDEREKDELQMWRQRAMGLSNPSTPSVHSHLDAIAPQK